MYIRIYVLEVISNSTNYTIANVYIRDQNGNDYVTALSNSNLTASSQYSGSEYHAHAVKSQDSFYFESGNTYATGVYNSSTINNILNYNNSETNATDINNKNDIPIQLHMHSVNYDNIYDYQITKINEDVNLLLNSYNTCLLKSYIHCRKTDNYYFRLHTWIQIGLIDCILFVKDVETGTNNESVKFNDEKTFILSENG